jgi:tRNA (pseudouridine54-N1)-methyltransferase
LHLDGNAGLSLPGFTELALLNFVEDKLLKAKNLAKNETKTLSPGVEISAFGFEKLISILMETHTVYNLHPKGQLLSDLVSQNKIAANPVFVLSDNLAMPKKVLQSFERKGMQPLSLGKTLLFASQCISIIQYELDK